MTDLAALTDRWIRPLAIVALALAALLAVQVGVKVSAQDGLKREADLLAERLAARAKAAGGEKVLAVAPSARAAQAAVDRLRQEAALAGVQVDFLSVLEQRPIGGGLISVRLRMKGAASAAAVDSLARWMQRHGQAVSLERLALFTQPGGGDAGRLEAEFLVQVRGREAGT